MFQTLKNHFVKSVYPTPAVPYEPIMVSLLRKYTKTLSFIQTAMCSASFPFSYRKVKSYSRTQLMRLWPPLASHEWIWFLFCHIAPRCNGDMILRKQNSNSSFWLLLFYLFFLRSVPYLHTHWGWKRHLANEKLCSPLSVSTARGPSLDWLSVT